jgi:hypothetical protein
MHFSSSHTILSNHRSRIDYSFGFEARVLDSSGLNDISPLDGRRVEVSQESFFCGYAKFTAARSLGGSLTTKIDRVYRDR